MPPNIQIGFDSMPEENEILTQIKALRQEVGTRLDDMDQRLHKVETDLSSPATQGFGSRLEEIDLRLRRIESQFLPPVVVSAPIEATPAIPDRQVEYAPPVPTTTVKMTVNPLGDVSRVRVVEGALLAIVGVEAVSLLTLSGDTAELQVGVQEDVSLIGGLRRTLPLAFDVSQSDSSTFAIKLAEPLAERLPADVIVNKAQ
jgi:hypothetical protein